jgi:hypothetical protein
MDSSTGYNVQQQKERCRMMTPQALMDALVFHSGRLILPMRTTYFQIGSWELEAVLEE